MGEHGSRSGKLQPDSKERELQRAADAHSSRLNGVTWEEDGKHPDVVIELTSDSTRRYDHGEKKRIYGELIGVPEYFIFDPLRGDLEVHRWVR
jgi:Uma2 family endonuclease